MPQEYVTAYVPMQHRMPELWRVRGRDRNFAYFFGGASVLSGGTYLGDNLYACTGQGEMGFIKFYLHLGGKRQILLEGLGEFDFNVPQLFILACPEGAHKFDFMSGEEVQVGAHLQLTKEFLEQCLGIEAAALPEPLCSLFKNDRPEFKAEGFPLSPELIRIAQAIVNDPSPLALGGQYYQAKATELVCLIVTHLDECASAQRADTLSPKMALCLHDLQHYILENLDKPLTLERLAWQFGVSKTSLVTGFRQHFGVSVFEFIKVERMRRAYMLLKSAETTVAQVAREVGYSQPNNFSAAFKDYFGFVPKTLLTHP